MIDEIIIVIKILQVLFFIIAVFYSIKNYKLTRSRSNIWLYISLAMGFSLLLSSARTIKEFQYFSEFEIVKVELIPLIITLFLIAAITVKKERGLPLITPASEPGKITYCGVSYSETHIQDLEKQRADATSGKREKCPVRICVEKKGIKNCLECPKYPHCHIRTESINACQLFRYIIEKAYIYLKEEEEPEGSLEVFVDLVMRGLQGLCITRTRPSRIKKEYDLKRTPIVWLTEMETTEELTISPQLERLLHTICDFIDKSDNSVILLDGADYLIQHNNFKRVLYFIHRLKDKIAMSNSRLIMSISPLTIEERELKVLEREADVITK